MKDKFNVNTIADSVYITFDNGNNGYNTFYINGKEAKFGYASERAIRDCISTLQKELERLQRIPLPYKEESIVKMNVEQINEIARRIDKKLFPASEITNMSNIEDMESILREYTTPVDDGEDRCPECKCKLREEDRFCVYCVCYRKKSKPLDNK